ncbi:MAG TPA: 30S ribosomal protein S9 [bacterium]|nr:30S ribosomal protein S9 [bacterium]HOL48050.1 30S ribosomal protein S9 [bacterium]HPQ19895.1 30S ribosomal protein S9 [bacterium]
MSEIFQTVGRRKEAVANVRIKVSNEPKFIINKKSYEKYFDRLEHINSILEPLKLTNLENHFDIKVRVKGGGKTGQADAIKLALSRAIIKYDSTKRDILKKNRCLTSDARKVERKKYGQAKARKRFQYSKR